MLREVRLYGHLGEKFGKVHMLDVKTPAEAVRALSANHEGFRQYLAENSAPGYKIWSGKENFSEKDIHNPSKGTIRIIPVVSGAGGGLGRVVLGGALIFASFYMPAMSFSILGASFSASSIAFNLGVSMILGGVSQMLFSPPSVAAQAGSNESANNRPSYLYDGVVNTTAQGNCVPILYGRMRVGSQVISAGLSTDQIPV